MIQKPLYLDINPEYNPMGFGDASNTGNVKCSPILAGVIGAGLMYALPPLLSGFFSGAREAWDERER